MSIDNLKLYEINDQLRYTIETINEIAENADGEISDDWSKKLDSLALSKELKILDIGRYIKSLKAQAIAIKFEADKLMARYKSYNNHADRLINYLTWNMGPDEKYKDTNTSVSWRKNNRIDIKNPDKIPDQYLKTEVTIMKALIKKDIKEGISIEGAEIVPTYTISIR